MSYMPFGDRLESQGAMPTDRLFTGQRLDGTGLYYYGARYYDPAIGRFISPDTVVPDFRNPQALNRYSYVVNNPLRYTDPTGHAWYDDGSGEMVWVDDDQLPPSWFESPGPPEPSLPIDPKEDVFAVVWGFEETYGFPPLPLYYHSEMVVVDKQGN